MTTAIDTNILLDILIPNKDFYERSAEALEDSASAGVLVVCDLVYAELSVHFDRKEDCDDFLASNDIRVQPLTREAHFLAGRVWRAYRRRGGKRERMLADFLIGAHAQIQAAALLSRDRGFYRSFFPDLRILDPAR